MARDYEGGHIRLFKPRPTPMKLWKRLWNAQAGRCFYCDRRLKPWSQAKPAGGYTLDHVLPVRVAGQMRLYNTVLACRACNHDKAGRYPTDAEISRAHELFQRLEVHRHELVTLPLWHLGPVQVLKAVH